MLFQKVPPRKCVKIVPRALKTDLHFYFFFALFEKIDVMLLTSYRAFLLGMDRQMEKLNGRAHSQNINDNIQKIFFENALFYLDTPNLRLLNIVHRVYFLFFFFLSLYSAVSIGKEKGVTEKTGV